MSATVTLIGNEGFHIAAGGAAVFVDAFYTPVPWVGSAPAAHVGPGVAPGQLPAEVILVTHAHYDHFARGEVQEAALRTGASVAGPHSVCKALQDRLPRQQLVELEPSPPADGGFALPLTADVGAVRISAFRTRHSRDHNSYLVEMPGFRFFHDGDNERTACLDAAALRPLDALLIGPWRGSGWPDFVRAVAAGRWFLMHLTDDEVRQHEAGTFLPDSCGCPDAPANLIVLHPGESISL